jgi:two-component system, sensor histidine kinase LadS
MQRLLHFLVWLTLFSLGFSGKTLAAEHIVEQAYLDDPSGSLRPDEVRTRALTPFEGLLTRGYGKGAVWVRLRIDPRLSAVAPESRLFLRIRPIYLDTITLHDEAEGFAPRAAVGDRHPLSAQDEPASFYVLKILGGSQPRDLWLRVESTSTRLAHFEVLDESSLRDSKLRIQSYSSFYLALIAVFIIIGVMQSVIRRDALNISFTGYQIAGFLHAFLSLGYARWWTDGWVNPEVLDRLFSLVVVGFTFSVLSYSNALLRELGKNRLQDLTFLALFTVSLILIGLQFFGLFRLSLTLNMFVALVLPPLFLILSILRSGNGRAASWVPGLPKKIIVSYFFLTMIIAYIGVVPMLGWSSAAEINLYSLQIYCFVSGLLMVGLLQYRSHLFVRQQGALLAEMQHSKAQAALEKKQRIERQQLLNMLGHELKTPMATLKMLLGDRNIPTDIAKRLGAPLMEMKDVVERTVQSGQLEEGGIELQWQACDLPALIEEQLAGLPDHGRIIFTNENPANESAVAQTDPHFLGVIIRNLLDNALKYSPDNSKIQLRLEFASDRNSWQLTVRNEVGRAGRPDPEKLFLKYWRSPDASYRSGSGQGLYIVYRLAALLGGRLSLEPDTELVSFKLEMPVATRLANEKPA